MGLVASQARILSLYARKSDLELGGQQICNHRTGLALILQQFAENYAQQVRDAGANQTAVAGITAQYNAYTAALQAQDKALEMQLKMIESQHTAVQTEVESFKKVIDKNIEMSFKTFG